MKLTSILVNQLLLLGLGKWVSFSIQVLANLLSAPLASGLNRGVGCPYVAFDLDPSVVKASRDLGFPVLYGDGSRPSVLRSAGISSPKAVMVMYAGKEKTIEAVQRIRLAFPAVLNLLIPTPTAPMHTLLHAKLVFNKKNIIFVSLPTKGQHRQ
ncbi:unnamed protein product [Cuscuta campestris]|uniref:RCK N-terminal domain-containing protein n=1 Tax=Cuscuta campestris TaxID=132261 RepID=A0A484KWK8_9ASTE|nr:unnamed protein product [Cuscuta campestris]